MALSIFVQSTPNIKKSLNWNPKTLVSLEAVTLT